MIDAGRGQNHRAHDGYGVARRAYFANGGYACAIRIYLYCLCQLILAACQTSQEPGDMRYFRLSQAH